MFSELLCLSPTCNHGNDGVQFSRLLLLELMRYRRHPLWPISTCFFFTSRGVVGDGSCEDFCEKRGRPVLALRHKERSSRVHFEDTDQSIAAGKGRLPRSRVYACPMALLSAPSNVRELNLAAAPLSAKEAKPDSGPTIPREAPGAPVDSNSEPEQSAAREAAREKQAADESGRKPPESEVRRVPTIVWSGHDFSCLQAARLPG